MTVMFRTISQHWLLLGCTCFIVACTLVSGICVNFEITKRWCVLSHTCNGGICEVDIASTSCNITCKCPGGYQGTFCEIQPTDVTIQPIHTTNSSTEETTGNTTTLTTLPTSEYNSSTEEPTGNTTTLTTFPMSVTKITAHVSVKKKCGSLYTCDRGHCSDANRLPCVCESGWAGALCNYRCNLTCMNRGICKRKDADSIPWCNCEHPYTGYLCDRLPTTIAPSIHTIIQKDEADYRYIAGVVVGAVVFVLIITSILCLILWKRRAIIILKLIHWFKPYEDDDYKLYDAFISYKSSHSDGSHSSSSPDELFVINTLMPKLEQELGFRLCVHFRDFLPGRHITENVLDAIENSRRTILLLSRNYIENSFWTRFEYEQAQVAAMERKQRIIPIILEDISDAKVEDHTLRNILDSITYITWPGVDGDSKKVTKFWTQLTLSMPKLMTSEGVTPVSYKTTEGCSYVEIQDTVVTKAQISNAPVAEYDDISIDISHDKSKNKPDTELIDSKEHLRDKTKEENLKAKVDEYVEILEGSV